MIALTIDLEIWPTPPLIFTLGVKKCKIWPIETLWFRNEATYRLSFVNLYKFLATFSQSWAEPIYTKF